MLIFGNNWTSALHLSSIIRVNFSHIRYIIFPCLEYRHVTCEKNITGVTSWSPPSVTHVIPGDTGVYAVTSLDESVYVVRDRKKEVEVYDAATLKLERHLSVPGISQDASGIAACPRNKCLYLSDWNDPSIHRVDLATDAAKKWPVAKSPHGLSVNGDHNLLVPCLEASILQEYTTDGHLVREISLAANVGSPWHAIQLSTGDYVVSHCILSGKVSVVGVDGRLLRSYKPSSSSDVGPMKDPRSLAVTKQDDILVADRGNNRILAINSSLTRVKLIPIPSDIELLEPLALYLDETRDRLYIGEKGGQHGVVVMLHTEQFELH